MDGTSQRRSDRINVQIPLVVSGVDFQKSAVMRKMGDLERKVEQLESEIAEGAWAVVETMIRKEGVYFGCPHFKHKHQNLASLGYPEGTECWYCVLNTKLLNKVVLCADTAPLAICRAALLWAVKHT